MNNEIIKNEGVGIIESVPQTSIELTALLNKFRTENGKNPVTHANVLKSIRKEIGGVNNLPHVNYVDKQGKERSMHNLTSRQSMQMMLKMLKPYRKEITETYEKLESLAKESIEMKIELATEGVIISDNISNDQITEVKKRLDVRTITNEFLNEDITMKKYKEMLMPHLKALTFINRQKEVKVIDALLNKQEDMDIIALAQVKSLTSDLYKSLNKGGNISKGMMVSRRDRKILELQDQINPIPIIDETLACGFLSYNVCLQGLTGDSRSRRRYVRWKTQVDRELAKVDFTTIKNDSRIVLSGCIHSLHDVSNLDKAFIDRLVKASGVDDKDFYVEFDKHDIERSADYKDHYIRIRIF